MLWGSVKAQTPSMTATGISFSEVLCNRVTVSWTNGDGARRMVIAREEQATDSIPRNDVYYPANNIFGTQKMGGPTSNHYVVYNGTGNSVIVNGLKQNTRYYFSVFEYNGTSAPINYLTNPYEEESVITEFLMVSFFEKDSAWHQCENTNIFTFISVVTQSQSPKEDIDFLWSLGDGTTSTDSIVSNHIYSSYGKKSVKLTATTTGCESSITIRDTVAPLPLVDFILTPDSPENTQVQCFYNRDGSKNRFYFKNTTVNPSIGALTTDEAVITWNYGDNSMSNQYHGSRTYDQPGTYKVLLKVATTKRDPKDVFCVDSVVKYVTVKPRPLTPDSIWFSDTFMCEEGNLFRFENKEPVPADSIIWFFGDGTKDESGTDVISHSYLEFMDGISRKYGVKLVYIDTAGCYDEYVDSVRVIGQPDNFFTGLDSPYCQFDPIATLTPNIPGGIFYGDYVTPNGKFDPSTIGTHTVNYRVQQNKCVDTFTLSTEVLPRPIFNLGPDTSICVGTSFDLAVNRNGNAATWQDNSSDSFINVSAAGLYWLELTNGNCSFRDSIEISVISPPNITLGRDSTLCGDGYRSVDVSADNGTYVWSDGYPDPERVIDQTGFYQVLVYNKCGRDSASVDLVILPFPCDIYVPTAFSPNGDHLNNTFRAVGNVEIISMEIYNRWGERLYYGEGPDPEWDGYYLGEKVQQGTYFFIIHYQLPAGEYTLPSVVSGPLTVVY